VLRRAASLRSLDMRQALIIVAAVIVIAGVGVGVYFMFFAGGANIIVAPSGDADTLAVPLHTAAHTLRPPFVRLQQMQIVIPAKID